jgi:hypothetical protein
MQTRSRPANEPDLRLPPPDPLSTVLLYVGAVVMALDAALAPGSTLSLAAPVLTMGGVWPLVPIVLMCAAALIWIVRGLRPPRERRELER